MSEVVPIITQAIQEMLAEVENVDYIALVGKDDIVVSLYNTVSPMAVTREVSIGLSKAWDRFGQLLGEEIGLGEIQYINVQTRHKTFVCIPLENYSIVFYYSSEVDFNELLEKLLFHAFNQIKDMYETVGLISFDGFPIWSIGTDDEFIFAMSISTLLTLTERLDMELQANGIIDCELVGTGDTKLELRYNDSLDRALAAKRADHKKPVTKTTTTTRTIATTKITTTTTTVVTEDPDIITPELSAIFRKINDPAIYQVKVPEYHDEEKEKLMRELLEEFEGNVEEELATLAGFDDASMHYLEKEITTLQRKFHANIISIGYLRKRLKLPPEVLRMLLEYLMSAGTIKGRIGKTKSGKEVLVLEPIKPTAKELEIINNVQKQIKEITEPLFEIIPHIPVKEEIIVEEKEEEITEGLNAFQVVVSIADSDPLYLFVNDLRALTMNYKNLNKAIKSITNQLQLTGEKDDLLKQNLTEKLSNQQEQLDILKNQIVSKTNHFLNDLKSHYLLLFQVIPLPLNVTVKPTKRTQKRKIYFGCSSDPSKGNYFLLTPDTEIPAIWLKLGLFAKELLNLDYPFISRIKNEIINLENTLNSLIAITNGELIDENLQVINQLKDLLVSNNDRDMAIESLRQEVIFRKEKINLYEVIDYCKSCKRWYDRRLITKDNICKKCQPNI